MSRQHLGRKRPRRNVGNELRSLRHRWGYSGERRLERFEWQLDTPTPTARLVGRENQFGGTQRTTSRELRLAAGLEGIDHIQHAPSHQLAQVLVRLLCHLDVAPVSIPFASEAYRCRTQGHFDHSIAADETVAQFALGPVTCQQQALYSILIGEEADPLALDGDTEDRGAVTPIDLTDHPGGRSFVIVEAENIEPMRAPIEEVDAHAF